MENIASPVDLHLHHGRLRDLSHQLLVDIGELLEGREWDGDPSRGILSALLSTNCQGQAAPQAVDVLQAVAVGVDVDQRGEVPGAALPPPTLVRGRVMGPPCRDDGMN